MQLTRENDTLFRLTRFGMINCFLLREDDGFTLIDTGLAGSAKQILGIAEQLDNPIRRIALTHGHIDHAGSIDELSKNLSNAEFVVGEREARMLRGDFSLNKGESGKRLLGFARAKTLPSQEMKHGDRIGSLKVIGTPGHTPGHLSFLDMREGALIAGDAFATQRGLVAAGVFQMALPIPRDIFLESLNGCGKCTQSENAEPYAPSGRTRRVAAFTRRRNGSGNRIGLSAMRQDAKIMKQF